MMAFMHIKISLIYKLHIYLYQDRSHIIYILYSDKSNIGDNWIKTIVYFLQGAMV